MSLLNTFIACIRHSLSSCCMLNISLVLAVEMKERVFPFSTSVQIPGAFVKSLRWLLEASRAPSEYTSRKDEEHFFPKEA